MSLPRISLLCAPLLCALAACSADVTPAPAPAATPAAAGAAVPATDAASSTLKIQPEDFPSLASNEALAQLAIFSTGMGDFPQRCDQLRLVKQDELSPRWSAVIAKLSLTSCTREAYDDGSGYLSYAASATFKPGAVTLLGLPVLRYDEDAGEMHILRTYVIDAPLQQLLQTLRPRIEKDCEPTHRVNPSAVPTCTMEADDGTWRLTLGELNTTATLAADPDNPAHSLYSYGGGD